MNEIHERKKICLKFSWKKKEAALNHSWLEDDLLNNG